MRNCRICTRNIEARHLRRSARVMCFRDGIVARISFILLFFSLVQTASFASHLPLHGFFLASCIVQLLRGGTRKYRNWRRNFINGNAASLALLAGMAVVDNVYHCLERELIKIEENDSRCAANT